MDTAALEDAEAALEEAQAHFRSNYVFRAIRTSQDAEAHCIRTKVAHAQLASTHSVNTYCDPPNIFSLVQEALGDHAASPPVGVTTKAWRMLRETL